MECVLLSLYRLCLICIFSVVLFIVYMTWIRANVASVARLVFFLEGSAMWVMVRIHLTTQHRQTERARSNHL